LKYVKCWDENNVNLFFTTESREKERSVFEKTHLSIEKISVEFSHDVPSDKKFITEQELRDLVIKSLPGDSNRVFLIVGETGCGKSELCQWLDYNIPDGVHIPLHISRSDTKIEDIARILNSHLPERTNETYEDELQEVRPDLLANFLAAKLQLEFSKNKTIRNPYDRQILEQLFSDYEFKRKLARDIEEYKQRIVTQNKERGLLVLSRKAFEFFPTVARLQDKNAAYLFANRLITNALKEYFKVSDLGPKLQKISEHYVSIGKRPVLLLEDLTSFTFLAEDLMDYIFDLSKGHFDVVIGWTTGFESGHSDLIFKAPDAMTYMRERLRGRFLMTAADKSTFFLKDTYKDLAKIYIKAIKCGKCPICKYDKDDLYPFTEASLEKIYDNLQEDGHPKQTPRIFLEFVIRRVLKETDPPWKTLSLSTLYLRNVASFIGQSYSSYPDFVELVKWYGIVDERCVKLPRTVLEWFEIESPSLEGDSSEVLIPMSQLGVSLKRRTISTISRQQPPEEQTTSEEDISDFQQWLDHGGKFLSRDTLRKGAIEQLQLIGDPCELKNRKSSYSKNLYLFYQRGESIPIFIEDSGDDPLDAEYKLIINRTTYPEVLEQLYYIGNGGVILEDQIVPILEWAKTWSKQYNAKLLGNLAKGLGMKVGEFALFSKFLLSNLTGDCSEPQSINLKNEFPGTLIFPVFSDTDLNDFAKALSKKSNDVQNLFANFFNITKTFFNYPEFKAVTANLDVDITLKRMASIDCRKIRDSYKWGNKKDNRPFRDLIITVRDYANFLSNFPFKKDFERMTHYLAQKKMLIPTEYSKDQLINGINNIKIACSTLQIPLEQSWVQVFNQISNNNLQFEKLKQEIERVSDEYKDCDNIFEFIQFARKYQTCSDMPEWKLLSMLAEISFAVKNKSEQTDNGEKEEIPSSKKRLKEIYEKLASLTAET
jgi:hypothetical protein